MTDPAKTETRGAPRKNRNYISFKNFERKFDCSNDQRRQIEKEQGFTVYKFGTMKRYAMHQVERWEKKCIKSQGGK